MRVASDRKRKIKAPRRSSAAGGKNTNTGNQRRNKVIFLLLFISLILIAPLFFFISRDSSDDLSQPVTLLPGIHSPPYVYNSSPPTSGNHLAVPSRYGFLGDDLVPEAAVHNMEHGAVVIWYAPDNPNIAGSVNRLITDLGPRCLVAGSYQGRMNSTIVATVWGRILELNTYDEVILKNFIEKYKAKNGPEAPFCRTESLNPGQMN